MTPKRPFRCEIGKLNMGNARKAQVVHLSDEAHGVRISVVPGAGGEMASLRCKTGNRWRELLYRALDYRSTPPDGWDGRAPLLWPAVGRSFTAEQIARWRKTGRKPGGCRAAPGGRVRAFPIHGFARHSAWTLDSCGSDDRSAQATCSLRSSPKTRKLYPFDFDLHVTYRLARARITCRYEVIAGANACPMPFAIGNHISFRVPLGGRGRYEDCVIRTPARRKYLLTELGLLSGRTKRVALSRPANLTEAIYGDTFLGGYTRRNGWVELCDPAGITLRVSHAETPVRGNLLAREQDMHFVFWGNRACGYFCPEPWIGAPNALNTGRGLVMLPPGQTFVWEMRLALKRA